MPFLDTEVMITSEGEICSRYYRKPQNKGITLHSKSHHLESTKREVVKNFYKTAIEVSSGPNELQHSLNIVDNLLNGNGYQNPRNFGNLSKDKKRRKTKNNKKSENLVSLVIPFTTTSTSNKIRSKIRQLKLPVRAVFTPGRTLKDQFCKSRPLDTKICELGNQKNCRICPLIVNGNCSTKQVVYQVTCLLCKDKNNYENIYIGETDRPCHDRFSEHLRAAKSPSSYPENAKRKTLFITSSKQ